MTGLRMVAWGRRGGKRTRLDRERDAGLLQCIGELARQNALLVAYREQRRQARALGLDIDLDAAELDALLAQQRLLRWLDALAPQVIAAAAQRSAAGR